MPGRHHIATSVVVLGKTQHLPRFDDPGPALEDLLTSHTRLACEFRDGIRSCNAALAFMSVGASVSPPPGHGPPVYRVHGSVCHYTGSLLPAEGADPVYAQLYVYDPQEALAMRAARNPDIAKGTLQRLQAEITAGNPYTHSFTHMHELLREEETHAAARGQPAR